MVGTDNRCPQPWARLNRQLGPNPLRPARHDAESHSLIEPGLRFEALPLVFDAESEGLGLDAELQARLLDSGMSSGISYGFLSDAMQLRRDISLKRPI